MVVMVTKDRILELATDPIQALRVLNRYLIWGSFTNPDGVNVLERDWDNLIILDACRYDYFERYVEDTSLDGTLERIRSRAPTTADWVTANFEGKKLHDIVCITANPWYERLLCDLEFEFHELVPVYDDNLGLESRTPDRVVNAVTEAVEEYPHKRLLIHFIQPHNPYIGPYGQEHLKEIESKSYRAVLKELDTPNPDAVLERAYVENLEIVLNHVEQLMDVLSGKTVVSADHGELLGERWPTMPFKQYGHHGILVDELLEVPWFISSFDERKEVIAEPPDSDLSTTTERDLEAHLEHLGYTL